MTAISVHDSRTRQEKRIKRQLLWFYIFTAGVWFSLFIYAYFPPVAAFLNIPAYLCMMLVPVQVYCFICALSENERLGRFSMWHYVLPGIIVAILGVWSLFVPWEVQESLMEGRGAIVPGYEKYSAYFLIKPTVRICFTAVYSVLVLTRLYRYYWVIGKRDGVVRRPVQWIRILTGFVLSILPVTIVAGFLPRDQYLTSWLTILFMLLLVAEHLVMGYNVINRNFLLYVADKTDKKVAPKPGAKSRGNADNDLVRVNDSGHTAEKETMREPAFRLNRRNFDAYMKTHRPWLDPHLRITDLTEPLGVNRTKLSNFVNKTYGVNFSRYMNRLRLREIKRLTGLPSNADKNPSQLALKAGFANDRGYRRAVEAERWTDTSNYKQNDKA